MPLATNREQEEDLLLRPQILDGVEDAPNKISLKIEAEVSLSAL